MDDNEEALARPRKTNVETVQRGVVHTARRHPTCKLRQFDTTTSSSNFFLQPAQPMISPYSTLLYESLELTMRLQSLRSQPLRPPQSHG